MGERVATLLKSLTVKRFDPHHQQERAKVHSNHRRTTWWNSVWLGNIKAQLTLIISVQGIAWFSAVHVWPMKSTRLGWNLKKSNFNVNFKLKQVTHHWVSLIRISLFATYRYPNLLCYYIHTMLSWSSWLGTKEWHNEVKAGGPAQREKRQEQQPRMMYTGFIDEDIQGNPITNTQIRLNVFNNLSIQITNEHDTQSNSSCVLLKHWSIETWSI